MTRDAGTDAGKGGWLRVAADEFDAKNLPWITIIALMATIFSIVALDQLISLHFEAWRLYPDRPPENSALTFWHGAVTGWFRPVLVVAVAIGSALSGFHAVNGRRRPLIVLVAGMFVHFLVVESTQGLGQEATPLTEIDRASSVSLGLLVLLAVVPLSALALSVWGLIKPARESSRKPLPPLGRAAS